MIKPRKLIVGLLTNIYPNNRKREDLIFDLVATENLAGFCFEIMGSGWEPFAEHLDAQGVDYNLQPAFDYDQYISLVPKLDYFLYTGMDEGSMAFLDALAANVKTIVTPQGFHLDVGIEIDHPFVTGEELKNIFREIGRSQRTGPNAVATWTWPNYASAHLAFWRRLMSAGE